MFSSISNDFQCFHAFFLCGSMAFLWYIFNICFVFFQIDFNIVLSDGSQKFSNGCANMYNAAGKL